MKNSDKRLTQLHVDVSAYLTALAVTALVCLAASGLCYVESCAKGTLLSSGGALIGWFERAADWFGTLGFD